MRLCAVRVVCVHSVEAWDAGVCVVWKRGMLVCVCGTLACFERILPCGCVGRFVGRVHEVGRGVKTLALGDLVCCPFTSCCGECVEKGSAGLFALPAWLWHPCTPHTR